MAICQLVFDSDSIREMTCFADGLTSATAPTVTVGTVSFPSAIDRTLALAPGFSQMLMLS